MLSGKVAVVTGSGRGIGAATARLLAAQRARVVVNDIRPEVAEDVASSIRNQGGTAISVAGNVMEPEFPMKILSKANSEFGSVDILVNNAGFTWDGMIQNMTDEQWDVIINVHVSSPFRMIRAAAPYMRDLGKKELQAGEAPKDRSIVNISSTSGLHGNVGQANYAAAKMGVIGLTKTVAKEWGPFGVRCNAVAYGWISTRLTRSTEQGEVVEGLNQTVTQGIPPHDPEKLRQAVPLARIGTDEEAAGGVMMLVSPWASYITGHTLEVTGGFGI
ncbi:hypothetical protein GUITHDRAFT_65721 [Guillardia theta CCMP2712]|uniref:3-oxoacyl-[acyl-carrier-protein] reductase n=1 Tax=Guillardia theta (strain CCMP2712) TaxID=905079 RepID=L1JTF3_GUITC|nr:hypothetical protein GUITHDRAFT_65721 [Guillardia theta CCMP2712]EKX51826.1 hypothetical protein GUITHDRAFT_65721 [Guillardia theta CCMP2712]|eukprot:XP_005838806.1 hypothetical protein GUITHDRAFT_65721 [Guillardia theta CCMP2712]